MGWQAIVVKFENQRPQRSTGNAEDYESQIIHRSGSVAYIAKEVM